jgi:peptide/nickel transport system permease protein
VISFLFVRVLLAGMALLGTISAVFVLGRLSGDPVQTLLPLEATLQQREALAVRLGLDQPILYQYWKYVQSIATGDFGVSLRNGVPVIQLVGAPFLNSLLLGSIAMLVAVVIGVPLGVIAAVNHNRVPDTVVRTFVVFGQSSPVFWIGMVAILVFAVHLGWLPAGGIGGWKNLVLPSLTLGFFAWAGIVRLLRSSMLDVLDSEYIKLARSKGLPEYKVIWKHALRNALVPTLTYLGFIFALTIAGAVAVEVVFSWPGLGRLAYEAVLWRDFPLLQFTVLCFAAILIVVNLLVDVVYVIVDPRIKA